MPPSSEVQLHWRQHKSRGSLKPQWDLLAADGSKPILAVILSDASGYRVLTADMPGHPFGTWTERGTRETLEAAQRDGKAAVEAR